jgi:hypothetical protein
MSDLVIRCSSIGKLMAKPENADIDPEYLTAEVEAIIGKTRRSDEERSVLDEVRRKSLSAGGKTHVRELLREAVYGYEPPEILSKPILKGREVEAECIAMLARLTGRPLVKNSQRRSNGLITGECDIWDEPIRHGRDVKAAYSMDTMPIVLDDCYDAGYEWQMEGYMILWDAERWSVDYTLVNTPEHLIDPQPAAIHYVDHIAERLRWTSWTVHRNRAREALIADKVQAARRYYRRMLNEFDRTHSERGPEAAAVLIDPMTPPWDLPAPTPKPTVKASVADLAPTF